MKSKILISQEEREKLVKARKIYNSSIHPDTKQAIPFYFKMSGFVIFNTPILFGVLMSKQTPLNIMFFQWANQSYNAGNNYAYRNATCPYTQTDMLKGYLAAVASSIGLAVGLNRVFRPITSKMTGGSKLIMSTLFNWVAVSAANASNIILMRNKELSQGVTICDETGKEQGKSVVAGKKALFETISS